MAKSLESVKQFYNDIKDQYTEYILRCVPRYSEMQWAVLHYIPNGLKPRNILEIGCGTGNLSTLIIREYPESTIHLVDISDKMIEHCKEKFSDREKIKYYCNDFRDLDQDIPDCDLVLSTISIHHIKDNEKQILFKDVYKKLTENGIFCYSDQFSSFDDEIYRKNISAWEKESKAKGATDSEWDMWMQHQDDHDHHAPLTEQINWLKNARFKTVECVWRHLLWTVLIALKK